MEKIVKLKANQPTVEIAKQINCYLKDLWAHLYKLKSFWLLNDWMFVSKDLMVCIEDSCGDLLTVEIKQEISIQFFLSDWVLIYSVRDKNNNFLINHDANSRLHHEKKQEIKLKSLQVFLQTFSQNINVKHIFDKNSAILDSTQNKLFSTLSQQQIPA